MIYAIKAFAIAAVIMTAGACPAAALPPLEQGPQGPEGPQGPQGPQGEQGITGAIGAAGAAPIGPLSFAAASAAFSGNGIGLGLSASNYSDLELAVVVGFEINNNLRAVAGVTSDFNGNVAGSAAVGFSF